MFKKIKIFGILIFLIVFVFAIKWLFFSTDKVKVLDLAKNKTEQKSLNNDFKGDSDVDKQKKEEDKEDDKKEFKNFGNFWIEIHKDGLDIKAPIENGTQPVDLEKGVGHHPTTAYPSKDGGNVVLSGHRWKFGNNPAYTVFEDLDKLSVGDKISLFYMGKEYIYRVREQKVVKDTEVSILKQTKKPQLTIYTCTPKYTSFRRLVYIADLEQVL